MLTFIQTHALIETHTKNTCLGILWLEFSPSPLHLYQSFKKVETTSFLGGKKGGFLLITELS